MSMYVGSTDKDILRLLLGVIFEHIAYSPCEKQSEASL